MPEFTPSNGLNRTHDPARQSWVESANDPNSDFPLQNLPFGVFDDGEGPCIGVAIGTSIFNLGAAAGAGLIACESAEAAHMCHAHDLNTMMLASTGSVSTLRAQLFDLLERSGPHRNRCQDFLVPQSSAVMLPPACVGDYTDFYASIHHARRVGELFRPERPLLPNYRHVPIGYHGRSSSIVVSGTPVLRPWGQQVRAGSTKPVFAPSRRLDYELEVGALVRGENPLGEPVPIARAAERIFGLCLLNDWSARDIQLWEYQPLGPFLGKNFATTISPWVVTAEALLPFRVPAAAREPGDPPVMPYLDDPENRQTGAWDIRLEATLAPANGPEIRMSRTSFAGMYWTFAQMLAHHASNGCNLRPGDLLGSGTVSGATQSEAGCLLELNEGGKRAIKLRDGAERKFLLDGDTITLRGRCSRDGVRSIGFGECTGTIIQANPA